MASTTLLWKKNLFICCIASFIVSVGMSQMAPILPLYIAELGVDNPARCYILCRRFCQYQYP